jgi:hypothetical protein
MKAQIIEVANTQDIVLVVNKKARHYLLDYRT